MARRFLVYGVVQGVGFRWFVARHAERLGLRGWVRNREDGTVEVLVSGEAGLVELARLLEEGPIGARVDRVEALEAPQEPQIPNVFQIK
ncbi:MAG TPA: acylphosphatase [Gemmatimonadales bacterium]|nr:acylphosphatase [Gemmatimonadales bacterium]